MKKTKVDVNRRKRLIYNKKYDDKKRVAKKLGLLSRYPKSIVLVRPTRMSSMKFKNIVSKYKLI